MHIKKPPGKRTWRLFYVHIRSGMDGSFSWNSRRRAGNSKRACRETFLLLLNTVSGTMTRHERAPFALEKNFLVSYTPPLYEEIKSLFILNSRRPPAMNKTELIALLQKKTGGSLEETQKTINAVTDVLLESLAQGEDIHLPGIGSIKVTDRAEHTGRHPQTGEEIIIPARKSVKFNPGKILRETVKSLDFITKNV